MFAQNQTHNLDIASIMHGDDDGMLFLKSLLNITNKIL